LKVLNKQRGAVMAEICIKCKRPLNIGNSPNEEECHSEYSDGENVCAVVERFTTELDAKDRTIQGMIAQTKDDMGRLSEFSHERFALCNAVGLDPNADGLLPTVVALVSERDALREERDQLKRDVEYIKPCVEDSNVALKTAAEELDRRNAAIAKAREEIETLRKSELGHKKALDEALSQMRISCAGSGTFTHCGECDKQDKRIRDLINDEKKSP
jgi:septal ring factor EnvC (AmiA/AmiB activator)